MIYLFVMFLRNFKDLGQIFAKRQKIQNFLLKNPMPESDTTEVHGKYHVTCHSKCDVIIISMLEFLDNIFSTPFSTLYTSPFWAYYSSLFLVGRQC